MLVYRLCRKDEILKILDTRNIDTIGQQWINTPESNTHIYQKGQKYLHFFLSEYEITNLDPKEGRYICTYSQRYRK